MSPGHRDNDLQEMLRALRDADAPMTAPPHVQTSVLAAWDAAHARPGAHVVALRPRTRASVMRTAGAVAASVILGVSLTQLGGRLRTASDTAGTGTSATIVLVGEPFMRGEPARVIRMRVPASTLAALGVRATAGELVDAVDVDVIVGEDGVARAIRVGM